MKDISLHTFPSSRAEALTMLYLKNQDLSACTPEDIVCKYFEAYKKVVARMSEGIKSDEWAL